MSRFTYSPDGFQRNPGSERPEKQKSSGIGTNFFVARIMCRVHQSTHLATDSFQIRIARLYWVLQRKWLQPLGADPLHHLRSRGRGMLGADRPNDDPGLFGGRVASDLNRNAPVFEAAQPPARSLAPFQTRAT